MPKPLLEPTDEPPMTGEEMRRWRKMHRLNQQEAAELLGRSMRQIRNYEKSDAIPRAVALACAAMTLGVTLSDMRRLPAFYGLEKP